MMNSISTQTTSMMQQMGIGQAPPPPSPPEDGPSAGRASGMSGVQESGQGDRPPPPPPSDGGGQMGAETSGMDAQSMLEGLFQALEDSGNGAAESVLATVTAETVYADAQSAFG